MFMPSVHSFCTTPGRAIPCWKPKTGSRSSKGGRLLRHKWSTGRPAVALPAAVVKKHLSRRPRADVFERPRRRIFTSGRIDGGCDEVRPLLTIVVISHKGAGHACTQGGPLFIPEIGGMVRTVVTGPINAVEYFRKRSSPTRSSLSRPDSRALPRRAARAHLAAGAHYPQAISKIAPPWRRQDYPRAALTSGIA